MIRLAGNACKCLLAGLMMTVLMAGAAVAVTSDFAGGKIVADYRITPRVTPGEQVKGTLTVTVSGVKWDQLRDAGGKTRVPLDIGSMLVEYDYYMAAGEMAVKDILQYVIDRSYGGVVNVSPCSNVYPISADGTYTLVLERNLTLNNLPGKEGGYVYYLFAGVKGAAIKPVQIARVPVDVTSKAGSSTTSGPGKSITLAGTPSLSPSDVKLGEEFIITIPYRVTGLPMTGGQTEAITEQTRIAGPSSQSYSRTRQMRSNTGETEVPSKFKATVRRAGKYSFEYTVSGPGYTTLTGSVPFEVREKGTGRKQIAIDSLRVVPQAGSFKVQVDYHATDVPASGLGVAESVQVSGPLSKSLTASRQAAADGRGQAAYEGRNFKGGSYTLRVTLNAPGYPPVSRDATFTINDGPGGTDWSAVYRQKQEQKKQPLHWVRQMPSVDKGYGIFNVSGNTITASPVVDGHPVPVSCTFTEPPAQLVEGQSITWTLQMHQSRMVDVMCWWQSLPVSSDGSLPEKTRVCSSGTTSTGAACNSSSTYTGTVTRTTGGYSATLVCTAKSRGGITWNYTQQSRAPSGSITPVPAGTPELVDVTGTAAASLPTDMSGAWYGSDGSVCNASQNGQQVVANTRAMLSHRNSSGSFNGTFGGGTFRGNYTYTDGSARGSGTMNCSSSGSVMNCSASGTRAEGGQSNPETGSWQFQRQP